MAVQLRVPARQGRRGHRRGRQAVAVDPGAGSGPGHLVTHVLTALGNRWDSRVATLLEGLSRGQHRPPLRGPARPRRRPPRPGSARVALVSSDLRGLDLTAVAQLRSAGVHVVGIAAHGDEESERRLRQLGVGRVVPGSAELAEFEAALTEQPVTADADPPALERDLDGGSRRPSPAADQRPVCATPPPGGTAADARGDGAQGLASGRRGPCRRRRGPRWWPSGARPARPVGPPSR